MSLPIPNLDNKTFQDLVAEARTLIPRYSREWTDHNIHDPGITFIELFAWLAETYIFELDQITDKNYERFFNLLGLNQRFAHPARTWIQMKKSDKFLSAGSQLIANLSTQNLVFESEHNLHVTSATIESILTPSHPDPVTIKNANEQEGIYFAPFGKNPKVGTSFSIGFSDSPGKTEITFLVYEKDLPELGKHNEEQLNVESSVRLKWQYLTRGRWEELLVSDFTAALTRSGFVRIDPSSPMDEWNGYRWIRCTVQAGQYEIPPYLETIKLNTIAANQIESQRLIELGHGTGEPNQIIKLENLPMKHLQSVNSYTFSAVDILDMQAVVKFLNHPDDPLKELNHLLSSVKLISSNQIGNLNLPAPSKKLLERKQTLTDLERIQLNRAILSAFLADAISTNDTVLQVQNDTGKWEDWTEVEDFEQSGPQDLHYLLDETKSEIMFGNGINGRIPRSKEKIRIRLINSTSGTRGNIPSDQTFTVRDSAGGYGFSIVAATGGEDAELLEDRKARAADYLRTMDRAVTSQDFEVLAKSTSGIRVARAKALSNFHPDFSNSRIPALVTVVVVPYRREGSIHPTQPNFLRAVRDHLNSHRLVTTSVLVIGPKYEKINVEASVRLKKYRSQKEAEKRIQIALQDFLNPVKRELEESEWEFGRSVYLSEIHQTILRIESVDCVMNVSINGKAEDYRISPIALVYSGLHNIQFV